MSDDNSGNKQSWIIPIVVATIGAISSIVVALINQDGNSNQVTSTSPSPTPTIPPQYVRLHDLLEAGKWKEADEETGRAI